MARQRQAVVREVPLDWTGAGLGSESYLDRTWSPTEAVALGSRCSRLDRSSLFVPMVLVWCPERRRFLAIARALAGKVDLTVSEDPEAFVRAIPHATCSV